MSDEKKRVVVAYTETEANTIRIELLEKKEVRNYGNINELEELLRETRINLHNRIQRYEEVLRELIKKHKIKPTPGYTIMDPKTKAFNIELDKLLEKLDASSVSHTVKKEKTDALDSLIHGIDPAFLKTEKKEDQVHVDSYVKGYIDNWKASRGEKTVEVGLGDSKDEDSSRKTVSKTSDSLTRFRDKVLEPFDDKPPEHITWQEVKEYLSKFLPSWKIVKREDLQWLLQMSKIARKHMGRPVDKAREKRIKEEYGIE